MSYPYAVTLRDLGITEAASSKITVLLMRMMKSLSALHHVFLKKLTEKRKPSFDHTMEGDDDTK